MGEPEKPVQDGAPLRLEYATPSPKRLLPPRYWVAALLAVIHFFLSIRCIGTNWLWVLNRSDRIADHLLRIILTVLVHPAYLIVSHASNLRLAQVLGILVLFAANSCLWTFGIAYVIGRAWRIRHR